MLFINVLCNMVCSLLWCVARSDVSTTMGFDVACSGLGRTLHVLVDWGGYATLHVPMECKLISSALTAWSVLPMHMLIGCTNQITN